MATGPFDRIVHIAAEELESALWAVLTESEREGVDLPPGYAGRVASASVRRCDHVLRVLAWAAFSAGRDARDTPAPVGVVPQDDDVTGRYVALPSAPPTAQKP